VVASSVLELAHPFTMQLLVTSQLGPGFQALNVAAADSFAPKAHRMAQETRR
jgi:hypothetical protein